MKAASKLQKTIKDAKESSKKSSENWPLLSTYLKSLNDEEDIVLFIEMILQRN